LACSLEGNVAYGSMLRNISGKKATRKREKKRKANSERNECDQKIKNGIRELKKKKKLKTSFFLLEFYFLSCQFFSSMSA
jgi:hypothetical protein